MTKIKFFFYLVLLAAAAYCGVMLYPAMFYSSNYTYENLTLYTHDPLSEPPDRLLSAIQEKIAASDFYEADQKFEVYLAGSYAEYAFLAPFCRKDPACAHPFGNKVFIASSDIVKNRVYQSGGGKIGRSLESVIIHELVKVQIKEYLGATKYYILSEWKSEGYAEHIAMETRDLNPSDFCTAGAGRDPVLPFLENRLIVEQVTAEDRISYRALMEENYSYRSVRNNVERRYCGK